MRKDINQKQNKSWQKIWYLALFAILITIIVVFIHKKPTVDESILDSKFCEKDGDCILTEIKKFDCCSSCFLESVNKETELEREKWRKQNCGGPRLSWQDKWKPCFIYDECGISKMWFESICVDKKCEVKQKK